MANLQQLSDGINISEVLAGLVEEGQLGLAQRWAPTLPQNFQISLVTFCVASERLKEAVKLVRHLNLQQVCLSKLCRLCKAACLVQFFALSVALASSSKVAGDHSRHGGLHVCNQVAHGTNPSANAGQQQACSGWLWE